MPLKDVPFSIKMPPQIQKQDSEARVSWRGQRGSWVRDFWVTDVLVILVSQMLRWGLALDGHFRD